MTKQWEVDMLDKDGRLFGVYQPMASRHGYDGVVGLTEDNSYWVCVVCNSAGCDHIEPAIEAGCDEGQHVWGETLHVEGHVHDPNAPAHDCEVCDYCETFRCDLEPPPGRYDLHPGV